MSQAPFRKFINPKKNSRIKEEMRQEKKKAKKERAEYFEKKKKEEFAAREARRTGKNSVKEEPSKKTAGADKKEKAVIEKEMPLNKYLAHGGVCSRRDAAALVKEEKVKVNGKIVTEPGYKVQPGDTVMFNNKQVFITKNLVYILLNKPKDYLTTTDDPKGRKTVLQLVKQATEQRIYPIGRLDRNTSGVLLLTNDGDLTQQLSHPSYGVSKIYEVKLDKPLKKEDFEKILSGLVLEDGKIEVDALAYADTRDKSVIGIELHSGRNRIVRRIFEHLGYDVKGLDRVMYAGLTKKNVERGKWRFLGEKEIRALKFLKKSNKHIGKADK